MGTLRTSGPMGLQVPNTGVVWVAGQWLVDPAGDPVDIYPAEEQVFSVRQNSLGAYEIRLNFGFREVLSCHAAIWAPPPQAHRNAVMTHNPAFQVLNVNTRAVGTGLPVAAVGAWVHFMVCLRMSGGTF